MYSFGSSQYYLYLTKKLNDLYMNSSFRYFALLYYFRL